MRGSDGRGGLTGSGWRFSWRPDRLRRLHELGDTFGLTEESLAQSKPQRTETDQQAPNSRDSDRQDS
jgi:hypothetical protein